MSEVDWTNVLPQGIVTRATDLRGTDGALPEPDVVVLEGRDIARANAWRTQGTLGKVIHHARY